MTTTRTRPFTPLFATLLVAVAATACIEPESELDASLELDDAIADSIVDRRVFEASEVVEPDQLERIDNGDGTWSYALPDDFDPTLRLQGNVLTWRYAGQARFSHEPTQGAPRTWIATNEPARAPREQLLGMKRIDRLGRIWRVDEIDEPAWDVARAPADAELEGDSIAPDTILAPEPPYEPGTPVTWYPASWDHRDCEPGDGGVFSPNEGHFWDGDGRSIITNVTNARHKTAVKIKILGELACSGVILRQNQVLTAAHCVSDDNNNPIDPAMITVHRADSAAFRSASDVDFPASYGGGSGDGGGTDFADDWAILELTSHWTDTAPDMDLSSADDTVLGNLTNVRNLAFPGFAPFCQSNSGEELISNVESEPIAAILDQRLRFKIDGTPGHSGSPIFFCPEGDDNVCDVGDQGFVIAVFAGWDSFYDRFVGPRSSSFIDAAVAFMDD